MLLISGVEHNGWFREVPSCELPTYLCTFWSCKFQKTTKKLSSLWNLLRLTMLKRIWIGRCAAVAAGDGPSQASTPAIVCAFIREIRSLMQQDWLRVEGDVRQLGGVCPSWFRGRDPSLPLQRFQSWWCAEDVLASTQLVVGGQARMVLKLSRFSVPGLPL